LKKLLEERLASLGVNTAFYLHLVVQGERIHIYD